MMKNALSVLATVMLVVWAAVAAAAAAGISILGLSPDICGALLVLVTLGVVVAHVFAARRIPIAVRIIIEAIVLYAAVPILWMLMHGSGLASALASGPIPFYARGAYVAVEVLLPLSALVLLGVAVSSFVRHNANAGARNLAAALAVALVAQTGAFAAGAQSLPTIVAFEHPSQSAGTSADTGAPIGPDSATTADDVGPAGPSTQACFTADQGAGSAAAGAAGAAASAFGSSATPTPAPLSPTCLGVRSYMAVAQAVRNALPQRDIEMIPLAQSVPTDANGIDTFVRDAISLNIYTGVMRGPLGTWLARAGNPTDKLTLLAALLKTHGIGYTWVRGTLSDAEVAKIVGAANSTNAAAPQTSDDTAILTAMGITQDQANEFTATGATKAQAYADQSVSFANAQADSLIGQLKANNVPTAGPDPSTTWPQALRTHYWLRLSNGTDLDPTTADLAPGSHLGTTKAETTAAPPSDNETAQIAVRVIETTDRGGAPSDTMVLEAKRPAYAFADQSATVAFTPPSDLSSIDKVASVTTVTPSFTMGTDVVNGTAIAVAPSGATLTGVRIEVERDLPGAKPEIFRRTIVGGETDAATIATHLVRAYHIVVETQPVNQTFATEKFLDFALGMRAYIAWAQDPASNLRGQPFNPPGLSDFPADALNYLERSEAVNGAIAAANKVAFVYDRPQIVMVVDSFDRKDAKTIQQVRFDIVDNGMQTVGSDRASAFRANVARGIADTYIEGQAIPARNSANTPTLLRAASDQNVAMAVLDGVQKRRPSVALPDAVAANLDQTFAHGQVAVAPQQMISLPAFGQQYGWWAIDPSGNTVGRMGSGAGQELVELSTLVSNILNVVNAAWAVLSCEYGTKSDCKGAVCSFFAGAALGLVAGAGLGAIKGLSSGSQGWIGIGLGGLPGPGWSPGGAACDAAGIGFVPPRPDELLALSV